VNFLSYPIDNGRYFRFSTYTLPHSVQTGSGSNPAFCPMDSPEVKRQGNEANNLPPSRAKVKNVGSIPPLLPYVFRI
jgi:hypothetical protein